jgi:histidinol phosphatase-like PHP family hydrolase
MIDLHMHSLLSDGMLLPSELIRYAQERDYKAIAITDHADSSNIDLILPRIVKVCEELNSLLNITIIPGIEITHVPPKIIPDLVKESRSLGAKIVLVHGETISEPVIKGTNWAALNCDIDILAHPGLISEEEVNLAKKNNIALEITTRLSHSLCNGYVFHIANKFKAKLIITSDAHAPEDILSIEMTKKIAKGSGLDDQQIELALKNAEDIVKKALS